MFKALPLVKPLGWFRFKYEHIFTSALVGIIFWSILCRRRYYIILRDILH